MKMTQTTKRRLDSQPNFTKSIPANGQFFFEISASVQLFILALIGVVLRDGYEIKSPKIRQSNPFHFQSLQSKQEMCLNRMRKARNPLLPS